MNYTPYPQNQKTAKCRVTVVQRLWFYWILNAMLFPNKKRENKICCIQVFFILVRYRLFCLNIHHEWLVHSVYLKLHVYIIWRIVLCFKMSNTVLVCYCVKKRKYLFCSAVVKELCRGSQIPCNWLGEGMNLGITMLCSCAHV